VLIKGRTQARVQYSFSVFHTQAIQFSVYIFTSILRRHHHIQMVLFVNVINRQRVRTSKPLAFRQIIPIGSEEESFSLSFLVKTAPEIEQGAIIFSALHILTHACLIRCGNGLCCSPHHHRFPCVPVWSLSAIDATVDVEDGGFKLGWRSDNNLTQTVSIAVRFDGGGRYQRVRQLSHIPRGNENRQSIVLRIYSLNLLEKKKGANLSPICRFLRKRERTNIETFLDSLPKLHKISFISQ
jgi:hypothetical protein